MAFIDDIIKAQATTLEATWWVLDREPGMDDIMELAGDTLDDMVERLKVQPFQDKDKASRLFLARYEFPKYGEDFQFPEAIFDLTKGVGFIDFLAGFPIDDVEMLVSIGEFSTKESDIKVVEVDNKVVAPVPSFFKFPDNGKILFNLTALAVKGLSKVMAKNLDGEPKPAHVHWWFRVNLFDFFTDSKGERQEVKFPVPGEFLGLGVRMMPDKPWGHQKSSPFMWSGNWMDTVFYTSGRITAVNEPTELIPFSTYEVAWRKENLTACASDFAEYRVDDRVTILKNVATTKKTQLWKDDDARTPEAMWQICPVTFYGLEKEEV